MGAGLWELIPTPAKARSIRTSTVTRRLQQSRVKKWSAETLLAHLRTEQIAVAPGVTDACVAHCNIIVSRLRLVIEQIKVGMKQLKRLCTAVAEIQPSTPSDAATPCDPDVLRSIPGVGPIVLAALLSEGYDAIRRRDASTLRAENEGILMPGPYGLLAAA